MTELVVVLVQGMHKKKRKAILYELLRKKYSVENIIYDSNGKPSCRNGWISFSHTKDASSFIYSRSHKVAIDIERMRTNLRTDYILKSLLTKSQFHDFYKTHSNVKFFALWTRAESLVKLVGTKGIFELKKFPVYPFRQYYYDMNCQQRTIVLNNDIMCSFTWQPIVSPSIKILNYNEKEIP